VYKYVIYGMGFAVVGWLVGCILVGQGLNSGLVFAEQTLYHLSHTSKSILLWIFLEMGESRKLFA
jgi:hypothetical protein